MRSGRLCLLLAACVMTAAVATHAASTSFWLVSTQTDFLKGEVEQLSVDSDGRVMLGPAVDTLHQTSTPAVWRLAIDSEGAAWAGTGNEGKVIKVSADGKASVVFDATELEIHAIAPAAGGVVYAGSSPDGKVYKITKDGKSAPFFDPEDKYIWTLLPAPDGTLYAGTGEKGRVYKIGADGTGKVFYESGTTHVTALAWDGKGALLVGTSSPGRVVRVDPTSGRGFVLLESAYKEVRSIKVSSAGTIFATAVGAGSDASSAPTEKPSTIDTTSTPIASVSTEVTITAIGDQTIVTPSSGGSSRSESRSGTAKGAVYRIAPDGDWDEFWTSTDDAPYDVLIEPNGSLLVATGDKGKIYRISGDPDGVDARDARGLAAGHQLRAGRAGPRLLRHVQSRADPAGDDGSGGEGHVSLRCEGHVDGLDVGRDSLARGDAAGHGRRVVHAIREHEDAGQHVERLVEAVHERRRRADRESEGALSAVAGGADGQRQGDADSDLGDLRVSAAQCASVDRVDHGAPAGHGVSAAVPDGRSGARGFRDVDIGWPCAESEFVIILVEQRGRAAWPPHVSEEPPDVRLARG